MKVLLIFIMGFSFKDFYNASVYKTYSYNLQELANYHSDVWSLSAFSPKISYETFKVGNVGWTGYYRVDIPIFSIQYLYLPFVLNANSNLLKFTKATNHYKTIAEIFNDYVDLWYFSMMMRISDSLIKIKERLNSSSEKSPKSEFDLLKGEKELLNLITARNEYQTSYIELLHKHKITFKDFPEESPEVILEISNKIKDSLLVCRKRFLKHRNIYEKEGAIYSLSGFFPKVSYTYLKQFMDYNPLNPVGGRDIKAFSVGFNVSIIDLISLYKNKKRGIARSRIEYKMATLESYGNKENLELIRNKIKFLMKVESFYKREIEMWKNGNIGFFVLAKYSQFYLKTYEETVEEVYKRSRINEK